MKVFDLELASSIVDAIAAHGERDYPTEACGVVLGRPDAAELARAVPMRNMQDRYHQRDPEAFPRTGRDAFRLDELERMRVLEAAESEGLAERILYHSHCDAGAYFSPEDRAMAVRDGLELMPGVVHVVVSIRNGKRADAAAFHWNEERKTFDETRVPFSAGDAVLPDLGARAMEGREAARPIRPYGGALLPRRITSDERERISHSTDKVQIRIDSDETIRDLARLSLGLLSPLEGFLRTVEVRSIEQSGRLLSGTPWRTPVTLEISAKKTSVLPNPGALIELVDRDGRPIAAMGLQEVARVAKDSVRLAGPVFVYDDGSKRDAAEMRAELLRRGMKRVLAVGPAVFGRASKVDLGEFDGVLAPGPVGDKPALELVLGGRDPWIDAVMAQNQGATHIWIEEGSVARAIEETLGIAPWKPRVSDA